MIYCPVPQMVVDMNNMPAPEWSAADAQRFRQAADDRYGPFQSALARVGREPARLWLKLLSRIVGPQIYRQRLDQVARHMNRNRDAFTHYAPRQGDVVVSAYFKAGTNWIRT